MLLRFYCERGVQFSCFSVHLDEHVLCEHHLADDGAAGEGWNRPSKCSLRLV